MPCEMHTTCDQMSAGRLPLPPPKAWSYDADREARLVPSRMGPWYVEREGEVSPGLYETNNAHPTWYIVLHQKPAGFGSVQLKVYKLEGKHFSLHTPTDKLSTTYMQHLNAKTPPNNALHELVDILTETQGTDPATTSIVFRNFWTVEVPKSQYAEDPEWPSLKSTFEKASTFKDSVFILFD
jgi:hypothetical protein